MQDLHSGTITRAYCSATYEGTAFQSFILPPEQGWQGNTIRKGAPRPENRVTRFPVEKSGAARIGGGERSEPVSRIVFMTYDTESKSRNADFISIARRAIRHLQRRRRCHPLSEATQPFYTTRGVSRAPFFIICGGAATTTL